MTDSITNNSVIKRPYIWSIAGSDCRGGAGIQADIKTAHAIGCEMATLITANTVQNSQQVSALHPVDVEILKQQSQALLIDQTPQVIKIGLITNNQQLQWLTDLLEECRQQNPLLKVIYDPVMQATVGQSLQQEIFDPALLADFIALLDVITPNQAELISLNKQLLAIGRSDPKGQSDNSFDVMSQHAKSLLDLGCQAIIVTGGDIYLAEQTNDSKIAVDYGFYQQQCLIMKSPRINTSASHGSGCSFASAIASFLAQNYLLRDALTQAKAFINGSLKLNDNTTGHYNNLQQTDWPVGKAFFPEVERRNLKNSYRIGLEDCLQFASLDSDNLGLYPVVDSVDWLQKLLPIGLKIIQLRLKNKSERELHQQISQAVMLSKQYNTRLFINDYWPLAIQYGAYGVHLGQEDLQQADLNAIQQAGLRLGISTHGSFELQLSSQIAPSYLAIGAIFPTQTKDMSGQIQGLTNLKQLVKLRQSIPVVAIGGITLQNAQEVIECGVNSIAVVTAITQAEDYRQAVVDFQQLWQRYFID